MTTKHLSRTGAAGLLVAALAVSACGSGSTGSASTDDPGDRADAFLDYARCMRDHGVDMPDPQVDAQGRVQMKITGNGVGRTTMDAAQKACQGKLKSVQPDPGSPQAAEAEEHGLKLAQCMREHGIENFPDPRDGQLRITPDMGLDPSDPAFQQAQEACEDEAGVPGGKGS